MTFTLCHCPEAELFRQVLAGEVPAADSPTWRALLALVDGAAVYRLRHLHTDPALTATGRIGIGVPFTELQRRRAEPACPVLCPSCGRVRSTWPPPATRTELACQPCRPRHRPAPWPDDDPARPTTHPTTRRRTAA